MGPHQGIHTPSDLRFCPAPALRRKTFVARSRTRNRAIQASDLRFYGAPKGIRILIVLVTIGTRWYSGAATSTNSHQVFGQQIGQQIERRSGLHDWVIRE